MGSSSEARQACTSLPFPHVSSPAQKAPGYDRQAGLQEARDNPRFRPRPSGPSDTSASRLDSTSLPRSPRSIPHTRGKGGFQGCPGRCGTRRGGRTIGDGGYNIPRGGLAHRRRCWGHRRGRGRDTFPGRTADRRKTGCTARPWRSNVFGPRSTADIPVSFRTCLLVDLGARRFRGRSIFSHCHVFSGCCTFFLSTLPASILPASILRIHIHSPSLGYTPGLHIASPHGSKEHEPIQVARMAPEAIQTKSPLTPPPITLMTSRDHPSSPISLFFTANIPHHISAPVTSPELPTWLVYGSSEQMCLRRSACLLARSRSCLMAMPRLARARVSSGTFSIEIAHGSKP